MTGTKTTVTSFFYWPGLCLGLWWPKALWPPDVVLSLLVRDCKAITSAVSTASSVALHCRRRSSINRTPTPCHNRLSGRCPRESGIGIRRSLTRYPTSAALDHCCSPVYQEDNMTEFSAQLSSSTDRVPLHELNHRTNNEFAAVIGGVSLAAATSSCQAVKRFSGNIRYPDIDRNAYRYQLEKSVLSCCRTFSLPDFEPAISATTICAALEQSAAQARKERGGGHAIHAANKHRTSYYGVRQ